MALPNKAGNAVLAKARALYGRRLTADDYKTLAACRSMTELAGALKALPLYAAALADCNPVFARRAQLENELRESIFGRYAALCQYDMSAGQTVYRYFILSSDLDEITTCLRYMDSGRPGDYLFSLPDFLQKHSRLDLYRLAKARDAESLLAALADTPYAAPLAPLRGADPAGGLLARAEPILSRVRHEALVALVPPGRQSPGREPGVRELVELLCDTAALPHAARLKHMEMQEADIRRLVPTDCSALSPAVWERLLAAPTLAQFSEELDGTPYGRQLQTVPYTYLREGMNKLLYRWCLKWLRFSTDPTLVMLCYIELAKNEVANLNHIIEGVHYGLAAEAILPLLIGYEENAA